MLYRKKNRHVWIYRIKVNGKTWERSTKETARRKAGGKVKELKRLAQLHREQPQDWLKLSDLTPSNESRSHASIWAQELKKGGLWNGPE